MTRRTFVSALSAFPLLAAETRQEQGKRLLQQMIAALGGQSFLQMRDRTEIGRAYSFYREDLTGLDRAVIYTEYVDRATPASLGIRERQSFGKKRESAVLFLENGQGFDVTFRGARPLPEEQLARYDRSTRHNILYILRQRLNEPGLTFELTGRDVIENQSVDILDIFDAQNENVTVYLNTHTKLPVRQRYYRRDVQTRDRIEELTRYSKYRPAGKGVQWPMSLQRERDTEKIAEIYAESVTIDTGLDPKLFELPSGIKLLKPV